MNQDPSLARVQPLQDDLRLVPGAAGQRRVDEGLSAGQERGPAMRLFAIGLVELGDGLHRASILGDG